MSLISVIIPIYNTEKYLRQCILSVLSQTYENFEVICVVDGCTDNSLEIVIEFVDVDARVKLVENSVNLGIVQSRIVGVENATGEYIVFVDSDDFIENDHLHIFMSNVTDTVDCICVGYNEVNSGVVVKCLPYYDGLIEKNDFLDGSKEYCYDSNFNFFGVTTYLWNKLFRRDIFIRTMNNVNVNLTIGEDFVFFTSYFRESRNVLFIQSCSYNYIQHDESMVKSRSSNLIERLDILAESCRNFNFGGISFFQSVMRYLDSCYYIRLYEPKGPLKESYYELMRILNNYRFHLYGNGTFRKHMDVFLQTSEDNGNIKIDEHVEVLIICCLNQQFVNNIDMFKIKYNKVWGGINYV